MCIDFGGREESSGKSGIRVADTCNFWGAGISMSMRPLVPMRGSLEFDPSGLSDRPPNVRFGSTAEVQRGPRNVWCWGISGSRFWTTGGLLVAISRLSAFCNSNRILAHRDAGGGSRPQHQEQTLVHPTASPHPAFHYRAASLQAMATRAHLVPVRFAIRTPQPKSLTDTPPPKSPGIGMSCRGLTALRQPV